MSQPDQITSGIVEERIDEYGNPWEDGSTEERSWYIGKQNIDDILKEFEGEKIYMTIEVKA